MKSQEHRRPRCSLTTLCFTDDETRATIHPTNTLCQADDTEMGKKWPLIRRNHHQTGKDGQILVMGYILKTQAGAMARVLDMLSLGLEG